MQRRQRGLTLIEILIVLSIIGLISGGIAIVAVRHAMKAKVDTTNIDLRKLHELVSSFRLDHPGDCPTVKQLADAGYISETSRALDAWDQPYIVACADSGTHVVSSAGPDGKPGTADDLSVPVARKGDVAVASPP